MAQVTKVELEAQIEELEERNVQLLGEMIILHSSLRHWIRLLRSPDHARAITEVRQGLGTAYDHIHGVINA